LAGLVVVPMTVPAEMDTVGSTAACATNAKARKRKRAKSFASRDTAIVKKNDIKLLEADVALLT
jgi:hypothetical protein